MVRNDGCAANPAKRTTIATITTSTHSRAHQPFFSVHAIDAFFRYTARVCCHSVGGTLPTDDWMDSPGDSAGGLPSPFVGAPVTV